MIFTILTIVSYISTVIVIISIFIIISLWTKGILPVLLRLGYGLARRKIAIFAKGDNISSIKSLLVDSKLFNHDNIFEITNSGDIGKAEEASVYLVYWPDWADDIEEILDKKPDKCAMVVYAPNDKKKISDKQINDLDEKRHTTVTNLRGRLLNDLVSFMMSTSYEEK